MWNKIKNLIIEEDPSAQQPQPAAAPQVQSASAPVQSVAASASLIQPQQNEFLDVLRNMIKSRKTAFTALLEAADRLNAIIPDQNTRLKAAFATVSSEQRGLKEILGAIEMHAADLEAQKMNFGRTLEQKINESVGSMNHEKASLTNANQTANGQIQSLMDQIASLRQMISANESKIVEIDVKISSETSRFTTMQSQFDVAMTIVKQELDGQKAAVASTLTS